MYLLSRICIISAIRLRTLYQISDSDISYHVLTPHIWSLLEPTVAICTACLPMARPVFLRVLAFFSTPTPPTGHSFRPKSLESHAGLAEETAVGPFRRLNEHKISLKKMIRSQLTTGKESGDGLETPPSKQVIERDLEGIRVVRE